ITFTFSKLRWGQSNLRQYIFWGLVPVLGLLLYQIIFRSRARRRNQTSAEGKQRLAWPGLDSEFYQLEQKLAEHTGVRPPNEPLSSWLFRAVTSASSREVAETLHGLSRLHYRYRFDPQGLSETDREQLRRGVEICLTRLRETESAAATS